MKRTSFGLLLILMILLQACATNPFTGKKTMALTPNSELFPMAFAQYSEVLKEAKVIKGTPEAKMLERVGQKLKTAAETYMNANGYTNYMNDYEWEFALYAWWKNSFLYWNYAYCSNLSRYCSYYGT